MVEEQYLGLIDVAVPVYVHVVRDVHVHIQFALKLFKLTLLYQSTLRYNCGNSKFKNLSF